MDLVGWPEHTCRPETILTSYVAPKKHRTVGLPHSGSLVCTRELHGPLCRIASRRVIACLHRSACFLQSSAYSTLTRFLSSATAISPGNSAGRPWCHSYSALGL